jgi:murein DD-endopeptidase MepM/ murein hydrolase activator NlpD
MHFVEKTALLSKTLDDITSLRTAASELPVGVPVMATHVSSRFGFRQDPFLHRPAFHVGLDLVAAAGMTVTATAPGTVVSAGWAGGYGQMVEVKHADGVSTRYGHLSSILVHPGMKVGAGTPIGRVGSTGRSTGPHLHYETRRNGNAVDPAIYLAAGRALRNPL